MDKIKDRLNHVIDLMEQDNRGVQLGCYSVALFGLSMAIRRVRPFSKFRKPSDVPNHFIKERRELTGIVDRIDPNGALLMVKHKPLVRIPGTPPGELPVKISGVDISGFGLNWLQTIVVGNEVKFVPVAKAQNYVQCEVLLPQASGKKKQRAVNVGESLVKIGFGQVVDVDRSISKDPTFLVYCNRLQVAEKYALRKKMGFKYYTRPATALLTYIKRRINNFVITTYRQIIEIPKIATS